MLKAKLPITLLVLLFMPAEAKTMQDLVGMIAATTGIASILLFFAGVGLVRRKQYGRWLNITLSLVVAAWIVLTLWPIEQRDMGDLSLVIPLVGLIALMCLPRVRKDFSHTPRVTGRRAEAHQPLSGGDG